MAPEGLMRWLPSVGVLGRMIRSRRIDYVLVGQLLPLGIAAWWQSFFKKFKYGVFLHGMDFAYALKIPRKRFMARLILSRADRIICANSYVADRVREFFPDFEDMIGLVNPGVDSGAVLANPLIKEELKEKYGLADKIVLFTLGRLVRRKGVDRTIQALAQIPAPLVDKLIYFVAGQGPRAEYLRSLVPADFLNRVIFLGEISDEDKWAWMDLCDIFVMPSRDIAGDFEGFGIVYLEANLCAKPVLAGQSGGVKDAVVGGLNGLIVDSESVEAIRDGLVKLAEDPVLRRTLGEQGRERALKEFNWEKQTSKLISLIKL